MQYAASSSSKKSFTLTRIKPACFSHAPMVRPMASINTSPSASQKPNRKYDFCVMADSSSLALTMGWGDAGVRRTHPIGNLVRHKPHEVINTPLVTSMKNEAAKQRSLASAITARKARMTMITSLYIAVDRSCMSNSTFWTDKVSVAVTTAVGIRLHARAYIHELSIQNTNSYAGFQ